MSSITPPPNSTFKVNGGELKTLTDPSLRIRIQHHNRNQNQTAKQRSGVPDFTLSVDFIAKPGVTVIFGHSGSGKTTLLDCVAGLVMPDAGEIYVAGECWFQQNAEPAKAKSAAIRIPPEHRRVGYVLQDLALFPHRDAAANIGYGLAHLSKAEQSVRVDAMLETFGIVHLRQRRPRELSGGERQRVALARALVTDPAVLLLDEPLSGLDFRTRTALLDDLRRWNEAHRVPILYVTHSREEVLALGSSVIVMEQGRVLAQGAPHEVLGAPRSLTLAQLAGFENIFDVTVNALQVEQGTMTCGIGNSGIQLDVPLLQSTPREALAVAIRAGDILLASQKPEGISARNVFPARVVAMEQRDVTMIALVEAAPGAAFSVHLTLAARTAMQLQVGSQVWIVIKTYSCHVVRAQKFPFWEFGAN